MNSKAIDIIQDAVEEPHMYPEGGMAVYVAQELAKENILVPDPPKPEIIHIEDIDTYLPIWEVGDYAIGCLDGLGINIETPRHKDPTPVDVARKVAYAILAAADYAEGK